MEDLRKRVGAFTVGYPGVREWLRHGCEEGLWELYDLPGDPNMVPSEWPEHEVYVFGAWHASYAGLIRSLRAARPSARVVMAWSSSPAEMDQAQVEFLFALAVRESMLGKGERLVDEVGCLHPGCVPIFPCAFHLPAAVHLEPQRRAEEVEGLGLYAPATLKKNIFNQVLAAWLLQEEGVLEPWVLHTNMEQYRPVIDGLGMRVAFEPWVARNEHLERLASRRVVMAASHAESWCYGAIDAMMMGRPVVASASVPCVPSDWRVSNQNDPREIAAKALWLADEPERDFARVFVEQLAERTNRLAHDAVVTMLAPEG